MPRAGLLGEKVPGARVLLLGKGLGGLGLGHLILGLINPCVLGIDLIRQIGDDRGSLFDLRHRLRERGAVVAVIDLQKQRTGLDRLVVGDRELGDGAADLGRDRRDARVDKSVIGRFEMPCMQPPPCNAADDQQDCRDSCRCYRGGVSTKGIL